MLERGRATDFAEGLGGEDAHAPERIGIQGNGESGDDFVVVFNFAQGDGGVGAVGKLGSVLELVEPLFLFFVELDAFQQVVALVEENHQRRGVGWERKSFSRFVDVSGVELGAAGGGDFDVYGGGEDADIALNFLRLFDSESDLVFFGVVRVGEIKFRSARAVDPLLEEPVDVDVRGFFDGFDEIGSDDVFAAIDL